MVVVETLDELFAPLVLDVLFAGVPQVDVPVDDEDVFPICLVHIHTFVRCVGINLIEKIMMFLGRHLRRAPHLRVYMAESIGEQFAGSGDRLAPWPSGGS